MYVLRQVSAFTEQGEETLVPDGSQHLPYSMQDVLPKYSLVIGNGEYTSDYIKLDSGDTYTVQLPAGYANTARLSCVFRSTDICKLTVVSPDHGTSNFLLKSTNGTTNGDHKGLIMWQGTVTSIVLTAPAGLGNPVIVDYFLFKLPDLTADASYRIGNRALGVVSE